MEWMVMPLRRYADFEGRSGRQEYWMFFLFCAIVYAVLSVFLFTGLMQMSANPGAGFPGMAALGFGLLGVFGLAVFIPTIAVQVRRFHDQDKSGWMILLALIPYLGGLIVLIFMCLEGTRGPNRFGPDPRDPYNANVFG
jgi:uncharacterized membrane protein YhaH (DUF805 family)